MVENEKRGVELSRHEAVKCTVKFMTLNARYNSGHMYVG